MKALGRDLTGAKRYVAPDDDNPNDETVMLIPLPEAIAPGASATIEVAWTAHVPRTFARTGAIGNFFFIAQWFPKLGVLSGRGLELSPVPCRHRVLLGFRGLRRLADGP